MVDKRTRREREEEGDVELWTIFVLPASKRASDRPEEGAAGAADGGAELRGPKRCGGEAADQTSEGDAAWIMRPPARLACCSSLSWRSTHEVYLGGGLGSDTKAIAWVQNQGE